MSFELHLNFPLACHENRDVKHSKPDAFSEAARRRLRAAVMIAEGGLTTDGIGALLNDADELTQAADARRTGQLVTLDFEYVPLSALTDLAEAILSAMSEKKALDPVELEAMNDLICALAFGLRSHVERETAARESEQPKTIAKPAKRAKKVAA